MTAPEAEPRHVPVMPGEVLKYLDPQPGQTIVDATVGAGGHARLLAERIVPGGRLIGLDQDPRMLEWAERRLRGLPIILRQRNFDELPDVLREVDVPALDAVLADLGFASDQLADPARGLSFQHDGPLDMRLDPTRGEPASALLRHLPERELADIFWRYGEERFSRRVARKIVELREKGSIATTAQLADVVRSCVPRPRGHRHVIDPATRVFQALRIAVNDELGALERLLAVLPDCVRPGGRVAIISFHSLEDRLVKQAFRNSAGWFKELTRKPVQADDEEVRRNGRARSAKLRAAIRTEAP
jgi:16S rRNA (cytosine1402-N4)-methyltransferase